MKDTILKIIRDRVQERSTWTGLAAILTTVGLTISPEQSDAIVSAGVAIGGLVLTLWPTKKPDA